MSRMNSLSLRRLGAYTLRLAAHYRGAGSGGYGDNEVGWFDWEIKKGRKIFLSSRRLGTFSVWESETPAGFYYSATLSELNIESRSDAVRQLHEKYDAVAPILISQLAHRVRSKREELEEMLAHAYVNAMKSGDIDNSDLSKAPERTQILVDQLLGVT